MSTAWLNMRWVWSCMVLDFQGIRVLFSIFYPILYVGRCTMKSAFSKKPHEVSRMSRRDLLFGMARRLRENPEEKPISGLGADIVAADEAYARKEYIQAKELYKDVLKTNRTHKEARIHLGLCHYHLGEYVQAKDTLLMVYKQHPDEYLACLYLGLAYARRERLDKCMEVWAKFVDPNHVDVMRELNVQRALYETGETLTGEAVSLAVEEALRKAYSS